MIFSKFLLFIDRKNKQSGKVRDSGLTDKKNNVFIT